MAELRHTGIIEDERFTNLSTAELAIAESDAESVSLEDLGNRLAAANDAIERAEVARHRALRNARIARAAISLQALREARTSE